MSPEAAAALAREGLVTYSVVIEPPVKERCEGKKREARAQARARTRLRSAKVLDANNAFLCEALMHDRSENGMRLLLSRNIGLPLRFGIYDDDTGDIVTASLVWRRAQTVGIRVVRNAPPAPLKPTQKAALAGRYYGMRD